jgi:hypothetical protein
LLNTDTITLPQTGKGRTVKGKRQKRWKSFIERKGFDIDLLIPEAIGRKKVYGERIKCGAPEVLRCDV